MAKEKQYEEAKAFFEQAIAVNDKFPNAYLGLGLIAYYQEEYATSFDYATQALLLLEEKNEVYSNSLNLSIKVAKIVNRDPSWHLRKYGQES